MVQTRNDANAAWSQVQNVYQRRMDLIPNQVAAAQGYARFEKSTLTAIVEARAKATSVNINPENPEQFQKFQETQGALSQSIGRLLVTVEQYPDLKAQRNFEILMNDISGSENRISTERRNYIQAVNTYNSYIQKFPNNMLAGMFGFKERPNFVASQGAETAPNVKDLMKE